MQHGCVLLACLSSLPSRASTWMDDANDPISLVVMQRGPDGFGVACNRDNVITVLKGRAASDGILRLGDTVVSVDGEELAEGERLIDRIRASPSKASFTVGTVSNAPPPPIPSLNEMMTSMMANPQFKKMASKMVAGMVSRAEASSGASMLEGGAPKQQLLRASDAVSAAQGAQVALAEQQQQEKERIIEAQVSAMLDSPEFNSVMSKVVESPAIQKVMDSAEKGTLCPEADGFHAISACLLDGGLLRDVADATCAAAGVDAAECERVHASAEAMLGRLGLRGDGWLGWLVRQLILRPWAASALDLLGALVVGAVVLSLARRQLRRHHHHCTSEEQARPRAQAAA